MTDNYEFKRLWCDNITPPADNYDEAQRLAEAAGWSWSKALVCPDCRRKIADGTFVRPPQPPQLDDL